MDKNYFISIEKGIQRYIFPEVTILQNNTDRSNLVAHIDDDDNPIDLDAFRATDKFNPYTTRISHPIDLDAFVIYTPEVFYKVIEGYYCLEDGTIRLKVSKKYGK